MRDRGRNDGINTKNAAQMVSLEKEIDAEAVRKTRKRGGTVQLAVFEKEFFLFFAEEHIGATGHESTCDGFNRHKRRKQAVDPEDRMASHLKMNVRCVSAQSVF